MTSLPKSYMQFEAKKASPALVRVERVLEGGFAWIAPVFFGLVTLGLFYDVLFFAKGGTVLSTPGHDITSLMYPFWSFAAHEMKQGRTPLWNPHIYSGTPFVGDFNTGIFYPVHRLIRWLPLSDAINCILAVDFFLAGYFAALWGRVRGLSTVGSLVAGMVFAFSGPLFMHLFPGHVPVVSCGAWIPLVFLAIDGLKKDGKFKWALVGGLAVGMQILTGFPQLVYYTALLAGIYTVILLFGTKHWLRMGLCALVIYVIGPAIGAVQLLPGLQTADESARSGGTALPFAAMTAMPPQNFLSVVTPRLFGDIMSLTPRPEPPPEDLTLQAMQIYWGAAFPWELSMFLGVTTISLALYGVCCGEKRQRRWSLLALLVLASLLAMGRYLGPQSFEATMQRTDNPEPHQYIGWWYYLLYKWFPLYRSFRGVARFNILIALFAGLLAGIGFDALKRSYLWGLPVVLWVVCAGCIGMGIYFLGSARAPDVWKEMMPYMEPAKEVRVVQSEVYEKPEFLNGTVREVGTDLVWAGSIFGVLGAVAALRKRVYSLRYAVAGLLVVELFCFARGHRPSGPAELNFPKAWKDMIDNLDPTYRVLTSSGLANQSMVAGFNDVFGYDPVVLKRYAQLMAVNQGLDYDRLDEVNGATGVGRIPQQSSLSIYRLMRSQFIAGPDIKNEWYLFEIPKVLRQLTLVPNIQIVPMSDEKRGRAEMFDELEAANFEPTRKVMLESQPEGWKGDDASPTSGPPLDPGSMGTVELVKATSDSLEIKADLPGPRILLVTDSYSRYWKVRSIETGPQSQYQLLPADYAFRGVPLVAGKHHIIIEYKPDGFVAAKALSLGTALGSAGLCLWLAVAGRKKKAEAPTPVTKDQAAAPSPI